MFRFSTQRVSIPAANSHFVPPGAAPDRIQISKNVTNSSSNTPPLGVGGGDGHKNPPLEVVEEEEEEEEEDEGVNEEKEDVSYNSSATGMFTPEPHSARRSYEEAVRLGKTVDAAERFLIGRLLETPYSDLATTIQNRRKSIERRSKFITSRSRARELRRIINERIGSTPSTPVFTRPKAYSPPSRPTPSTPVFTRPKVYSPPSRPMRRDTLNLNSPIGSAPNFSK